jgi:hypothetical protein
LDELRADSMDVMKAVKKADNLVPWMVALRVEY